MPSNKHVVSVRLDDQQAQVLARFVAALGMSRGAVVVEVLEDMLPYMERMAEAMSITAAADDMTKSAAREVVFRKMTDEEARAEAVEQEALQSLGKIMAKVDVWSLAEASAARRGAGAERVTLTRRRREPPSL